jgi:hypothetical protein
MTFEMFENTVEKFGKNVGLIHVSISSVLTIVFLISIPLHIAFNYDDLDIWDEIVTVGNKSYTDLMILNKIKCFGT